MSWVITTTEEEEREHRWKEINKTCREEYISVLVGVGLVIAFFLVLFLLSWLL